jgi:hypothetical protein
LVHEATHGRLANYGIGRNSRAHSRIERCCYNEETRFVARVIKSRPQLTKFLSREFVERPQRVSWVARLESLGALVGRLRRTGPRPKSR